MIKKYECYIFDVDGTLASTNELIFASFNYVTDKFLNKTFSPEEIISFFGPPENDILKLLMKDDFESAKKSYYEFYQNEHAKFVKPDRQMNDTVYDLKIAGKKLAIFTGKGDESCEITLKQLGIYDCFAIIKTGDNVKTHKPDPSGINEILKRFSLSNNDALMIGDSPSDTIAAKKAGVDSAAVMWYSYAEEKLKNLNPEYIFESSSEFRSKIINSLN